MLPRRGSQKIVPGADTLGKWNFGTRWETYLSSQRSAGALYRDYRVAQWCGAGDGRVQDFDMRSPRARQALELARAMTSEKRQEYLAKTARAQARVEGEPIEVEGHPSTKASRPERSCR